MAQIEDKETAKELLLMIEDTKTRISILVRNSFILFINYSLLYKKLSELINSVKNEIRGYGEAYETLADEAVVSLNKFAKTQIEMLEKQMLAVSGFAFLVSKLIKDMKTNNMPINKEFEKNSFTIRVDIVAQGKLITERYKLDSSEYGYGQIFLDAYHKQVQATMHTIAETSPKVDSKGRKLSLRNLAEMTVRYEVFQNSLKDFEATKTKYVLASQHQDASLRCAPWQGLLYVIDVKPGEEVRAKKYKFWQKGPSQVAKYVDGKPFYSLRQAMENGFLGYNCRHRLIPYDPKMKIPPQFKYNSELAEKKRKVDETMRKYERAIRVAKERQTLVTSPEERKVWQDKSKELQDAYDKFAKANGRVRNDWRASISNDEREIYKLGEVKTAQISSKVSEELGRRVKDNVLIKKVAIEGTIPPESYEYKKESRNIVLEKEIENQVGVSNPVPDKLVREFNINKDAKIVFRPATDRRDSSAQHIIASHGNQIDDKYIAAMKKCINVPENIIEQSDGRYVLDCFFAFGKRKRKGVFPKIYMNIVVEVEDMSVLTIVTAFPKPK